MDTQVPENIQELDAEALDALETALTDEFNDKYESETPASLEDLGQIADALDTVRVAKDERVAAAVADTEKRAELAARVAAESAPAEDADIETEVETEIEAEVPQLVEAAADTETVNQEDIIVDQEAVTASGAKAPSASAINRRTAPPVAPDVASQDLVITASADVQGFGNGQRIGRLEVAEAMHSRARGLGDAKGKGTRFGVASVSTNIPSHLVVQPGNDAGDIMDLAVSEQLAGKDAAALVASGGWCAPSETVYDTFGIESRDGLIDLPTIGVTRGGVQHPEYMGLDAVAGALWTWSEANDITPGSDGAATKGVLKIACPTWVDVRLGAEGLCVTHGNLMDRAYPEGTARFLDLTMTAHMHRLSAAKVASIVATATSVTYGGLGHDSAAAILDSIDLQVADYRSQYLMGMNSVLDAVFPTWVHAAIRSSLAMRAGVDMMSVSDAQVTSFFTMRNIRPQFVTTYGALYDAAAATEWPATVTFLLYPAGGYVEADGGMIDLGVVRDSTLNETNDFTAAWSEQFYAVLQRGPAAREVTAAILVDGITGGPSQMPVAA